MLHCLSLKSSSSTTSSVPNSHSYPPAFSPSPPQDGHSADHTPVAGSSSHPYPTINLNLEFNLATQTHSYQEILSKIHEVDSGIDPQNDGETTQSHLHLLEDVLHPNRRSVQEALLLAEPNTPTNLVCAYFDHSESTSRLCLLLHRIVFQARALYAPLDDLLDVLNDDSHSLSQSQCSSAFDVFLKFDSHDNPFPSDSHNFNDIRGRLSQLKQQVDSRLRKSRSRICLLRGASTGSAICFIGTALGVIIATVTVTVHALGALVAAPLCTKFPTPRLADKEVARMAQLDAAAKGVYVLNNDLDTIDRLVARLHTAVEGDKLLVRLGLERGRDRHPIQEVVKQLRKNHPNLIHQLKDLEEHLCLCFNTVNRARSLLLQQISLHQTLMLDLSRQSQEDDLAAGSHKEFNFSPG